MNKLSLCRSKIKLAVEREVFNWNFTVHICTAYFVFHFKISSLQVFYVKPTLRNVCENASFRWAVISCSRAESMIRSISPYSVRMRENTDQNTPNTDPFYAVNIIKIIQSANPNGHMPIYVPINIWHSNVTQHVSIYPYSKAKQIY